MTSSPSKHDSVASLSEQTASSLTLDSNDSPQSSDSPEPSPTSDANNIQREYGASPGLAGSSSRPVNAIGSGGGGPPPRMPSQQQTQGLGGEASSPALRPGGPQNIGSGGPGNRVSANERTRQMAATRLPPSLQARLTANANRSSSSSNSGSPGVNNVNSPFGSIGPDTKLDMNAFTNGGGRSPGGASPSPGQSVGGNVPGQGSFRIPASGLRPAPGLPPGARPPNMASGGPGLGGLGARRKGPGLRLSDMGDEGGADKGSGESSGQSGSAAQRSVNNGAPSAGRRLAPPGKLASAGKGLMSNAFEQHKNIVDPSGRLRFDGKAVLSASGVEFRNGTSFKINMEELDLLDELGKGAYGTVRKVRHTKTHVQMAMKEIRLELDDSKLNGIIMELDILHRATAPEIVEFYGAFFYESCVYYCIEFMDAGSLENLYDGACSVPEDVLARIVGCMVRGLRFLKDNLQIMHRDVKPTNVLLNQKGEVKLCDFGVSGQLEKSLAKTNIGCQSYMAPERIKGESQNLVGTYTVASDVWSLGLSIVETTLGTYPYPPETYSNVFAQLQAIVHGDPPQIPLDFYSETAAAFVAGCLEKVPAKRSTYKQMLEHPWLVQDRERGEEGVDMAGWVQKALVRRAERREKERSEATLGK